MDEKTKKDISKKHQNKRKRSKSSDVKSQHDEACGDSSGGGSEIDAIGSILEHQIEQPRVGGSHREQSWKQMFK